MNQKGFANIIIIVIVVLLAGTVGYFALVKKPTESPIPITEEPTSLSPTQTNSLTIEEDTENTIAEKTEPKNTAPTTLVNENTEASEEKIKSSLPISSNGVPAGAIAVVEEYIVSKVGNAYFHKNYMFLDSDTHVLNKETSQYVVAYEYIPATKIGQTQQKVAAHLFGEELQYMNGIYDCIHSPQFCEFNITKEQALEIAAKQGFKINLVAFNIYLGRFENRYWEWKVSEGIPNAAAPTCGSAKSMYIDVSTGNSSAIRESEVCQ